MHRHSVAKFTDRKWMSCIDPQDQEHDERAHNNVVIHEFCTCGAERYREVTLEAEHTTLWELPTRKPGHNRRDPQP